MDGVLTFIFLFFGWIWLSSRLTAENKAAKTHERSCEISKSRRDRVSEQLIDYALERRLREKLFSEDNWRKTFDLYEKRISEILGSEDRVPLLYIGDSDSKDLVLMIAMSDYGKVPSIRVNCRTEASFFYRRFSPHLTESEIVKLLYWYEQNLWSNGGTAASIMAFVGQTGFGAIYFDGMIIPDPPNGRRLW